MKLLLVTQLVVAVALALIASDAVVAQQQTQQTQQMLSIGSQSGQTAPSLSHHAQWGNTGWDSELAFSLHVQKGSRLLKSVEERVTFPPKGVINTRPIQAIRAYDLKTNGHGATATIVAGGINQTTVTVLFKSKRSRGIQFRLEVFTTAAQQPAARRENGTVAL